MTSEESIRRLKDIKESMQYSVYLDDLSDACNTRQDLEEALRRCLNAIDSLIDDLEE